MRIASNICGVASGSDVFLLRICERSLVNGSLSCRLDTRCNQLYLVLAIANRPIASSLANDIDQLEERALVPSLSNLLYLSVRIEADDVDLRKSAC